jgi:hypothetical protein
VATRGRFLAADAGKLYTRVRSKNDSRVTHKYIITNSMNKLTVKENDRISSVTDSSMCGVHMRGIHILIIYNSYI